MVNEKDYKMLCLIIVITLFLDSLLKVIHEPIFAYANDFKLLVEVKTHNYSQIQGIIVDVIANWSNANRMPLSTEKCTAVYFG